MITKTFEVVITKKIRVNLPDVYATPEMIADWERGLWELDNGVTSIAEYAARLAATGFAECNNDGVGEMETVSLFNFRNGWAEAENRTRDTERTVTYEVLEDDAEATEVTS